MRDIGAWVQRHLWIFGLVVIVGGGLMYVQSSYRQQQAVACQAAYNEAFAAAINERSAAGTAEREALLAGQQVQSDVNTAQQRLITTIITNTSRDPDVRTEALRDFVDESEAANQRLAESRARTEAAVTEANRLREANPIPRNRC
jgi:hypothetical protein